MLALTQIVRPGVRKHSRACSTPKRATKPRVVRRKKITGCETFTLFQRRHTAFKHGFHSQHYPRLSARRRGRPSHQAGQTKKLNLKGLVAGAVAASFVLGLLAATAMTSPAPRAPAALSSHHHDLKCGYPEEAKSCTTHEECSYPCGECHTKHTAKNKAWLGKCFSSSGPVWSPMPAPPHEHLKCSHPSEAKRCKHNSDCSGQSVPVLLDKTGLSAAPHK